jgi:hypothetical protein
MLSEVYEINLIDNDLGEGADSSQYSGVSPFEQVIQALASVPKLTSLHINLHEETQVDLVIKTLPNLTHLNGEEIDRDELQEGASQSEPLNDSKTPTTNQSIKQINEAEEIEEDDPTEQRIYVEVTKDNLEMKDHNSSNSGSCEGLQSNSEEMSLKPRDLEIVALIFDKIRDINRTIVSPNMNKKIRLSNDKQMASEFDQHLKG